MVNRKLIWKTLVRTLISIFVILALIITYFEYSHFQYHKEMAYKIRTLKIGHENLKALIEYQDKYFQRKGEFKPIGPNTDLSNIPNFETCSSTCSTCEYSVKTHNQQFTATAKCQGKDGLPHYLGYVRVSPGQHKGTDGYYGKCKSEGIYAGNRHLVNTIGPCDQQNNGYIFIASGSKKRLIIETLPPDAEVEINSIYVGVTSESHNATTNGYGSLYISEPPNRASTVIISKEGYEPVTFSVDWESYNYKATVVLKENPE